jgi:hypothetical protein
MAFGLAGTATAQTTSASTQPTAIGPTVSYWTASGFVGTGFGTKGDSAAVDENAGGVAFGGQLAYLWHGYVGPEFLAEWAPTFDVTSALVENNPRVGSYMANAIAAIPLGANGQIAPYASGGFGGITMRADVLNSDGSFTGNSEMRWGTNIGGGVMAFASRRIGLRGDVRYYHAGTDNALNEGISPQGAVVQRLVSGLEFWRTTGGVTFRW